MWVRNTSGYPDDEVRELIENATRDLDMRRVCVNVKGTKGADTRAYAYGYVPDISNAPPSAEYLITIRLPKPYERETWNAEKALRRGGSRWPVYATHDWREALIVAAAHEAKHIEQYREGLRRSEVQCEHAGRYALARYRGERERARAA